MMREVRYGVLLMLLMAAGLVMSAQERRTKDDYLEVVQRFYTMLYSQKPVTPDMCMRIFGDGMLANEEAVFDKDSRQRRHNDSARLAAYFTYYNSQKSTSMYFLKLRTQMSELTSDVPREEMRQIVYASTDLIDTGENGSVLIKVTFRNKQFIHFALGRGEKIEIRDIFLPNGASVDNTILPGKSIFLELPGRLKDREGYVNVRNLPDPKSLIAGRIKDGEKVMYIPDGTSDWWKVMRQAKPDVVGYVPSDKISMELRGKRK
jgi:hypothetical protein